MKPIILTLIAIVSALLTTSATANPLVRPSSIIYAQQTLKRSPWQQFSSGPGNFTILMPGKPTQESDTDADGSITHNFTVVNGETVYLVTYSDLAEEVTQVEPGEIFDAVCGGYAADGDRLVNQREIELSGYPGRSVELKANDGMSGKASMYLIGNRLYQLLLISPESGEGKQFFDSFQLTEKQ
jgi:hypothetical protein